MENRKFSYTVLVNEIDNISSNFPEYNHIKIANQIFIQHNVAVSSQKVFSILRILNKNNLNIQKEDPIKRKAKRKISPQQNPKWHRDEIILALDLYYNLNPNQIKPNNPQIIELSKILNSLPIHSERLDYARFRNPNGVALKLTNFLALDPEYPGKGMSAYSKLDKSIWDEFNQKKDDLHNLAVSIIKSIPRNDLNDINYEIEDFYRNEDNNLENIEQYNKLISQLFSDNIYKLFVEYCKKNSYIYFSDLQEFDFNKLYSIPSLGVKKISNIIAIYEKYKKESKFISQNTASINIADVIASKPVSEESLSYFPLYSNSKMDITITSFHKSYKMKDPLQNLNLSPRSRHSLQALKITYLGELLRLMPNQIKKIRNCGVKTVSNLQEDVRKYLLTKDTDLSSSWHSFDSMIKSIIKISDRNLHIFKNRLGINLNSPQTLDDSGYPFGLTRERTRQILSSIDRKLKTNINNNLLEPFWLSIDLVLSKYHGYIDSKLLSSEIIDLLIWDIPIEGHAVLEFSKLNPKYILNDDIQIIGMKDDSCLECKHRVEFIKKITESYDQFTVNDIYGKYFELCKDTCSFYDHRKLLNHGQVTYQISNIDYSGFLKKKDDLYYSFERYEAKKKYDRRNRLRENNSSLILIEDYLESKTSEVSSDEIQFYLQTKGHNLNYYLANITQRSEYVLSWGRGLYIHLSKIHISDNFDIELQSYLNQELNIDNLYIAIHKVFKENEELCIDEDIPNPIALYTVLSLSLYSFFIFPGYPLITIKDNKSILSLSEIIEEFIKPNENGIDNLEVKDYFVNQIGISVRSFRFQVSNNSNIIKQGDDILIHKKYLVNATDENNISQFVEALLSKGKLSEFALQNHLEESGVVKSLSVSLSLLITINKNINLNNDMLSINEKSHFYNLNESEIKSNISKLNFLGLKNKSIHSYLLSELISQNSKDFIYEEDNPLDDILAEFG